MYSGQAPLKDIFREEVTGQLARKPHADVKWESKRSTAAEELESGAAGANGCGKMLVLGMGSSPVRYPDS
jgi:hypothetical protein